MDTCVPVAQLGILEVVRGEVDWKKQKQRNRYVFAAILSLFFFVASILSSVYQPVGLDTEWLFSLPDVHRY